jgi:hypothetical protein
MDRRCGECTLCCTLLPVVTLEKLAGERCRHQRGLGCSVYHKPGFPGECGLWNCRWLIDDSTAALARPDQSHYVIDIVPDFVTATPADGGDPIRQPVLQVWIDPRFPDAHRDPAFRAWVVATEPRCAVLCRFNERDALFLIPPHMSSTGDWEEVGGNRMRIGDHSHGAEETAAALTNSGAMK